MKVSSYRLVCVLIIPMRNSSVAFAACLFIPCAQGLIPCLTHSRYSVVAYWVKMY